MKIYTRSGDDGTTGLFGGARVAKSDARVEAYGSVDEASSAIGLARSFGLTKRNDEMLHIVQQDLFRLAAELATLPKAIDKLTLPLINEQDIQRIEQFIDEVQQGLQPLKSLVLPAGTTVSCSLHVARTVVRRAERRMIALGRDEIRHELVHYVNRLSDLLFCLARAQNQSDEVFEK